MAGRRKSGEILDVNFNGAFAYHIVLENSFDALSGYLEEAGCCGRRVCIVSDTNVAPLYLDEVKEIAASCAGVVETYVFPAGEASKTLDTVRDLYQFLIGKGFDRHDLLLALGGGVTGDITGFAAATYLRGIRFIQVSTTLLSQVDSSIGGKTGVDFDSYKNMVGAFHMPALVYINTAVLETLPDEQFASGMGEVLKSGLIRDADFYEWTINHMSEIEEKDARTMLSSTGKPFQSGQAMLWPTGSTRRTSSVPMILQGNWRTMRIFLQRPYSGWLRMQIWQGSLERMI